jgi:chromosome segregation ATPase
METNPNTMTNNELRSALADKRAECTELHEITKRLSDELQETQKTLTEAKRQKYFSVLTMIQERQDLQSRVMRLSMRIAALGYTKEGGVEPLEEPLL